MAFYISDFWHNVCVVMAILAGLTAFAALVMYYVDLVRRR